MRQLQLLSGILLPISRSLLFVFLYTIGYTADCLADTGGNNTLTTCRMLATATPGTCQPVTNQYTVTGTVSFSFIPAGALTITDDGADTNPKSNGQVYTVTATYSNSVCTPASKIYTAPAACSVTPVVSYALSKIVNKNRVGKGGIVTYTISLTNTGNTTATNLFLTDQLSNTAVTFMGSVSASSGTFTAGLNNGSWAIPSLAAGAVATLAFNVQLNREGITYNTITGPDGHTVTVCTSVPYRVCATEDFEFRLSAPASFSAYQWSLNGQPIAGAITNTLSATALGEYSVTVNGEGGCATGSCCPYIIESYGSPPSLTAVAIAASCNGATPLSDAKITLTGSSSNAVSYNLSQGNTFAGASLVFATNQPLSVLVDGLLLTGQPNPAGVPGQSYTIRIYSAEGCYSDIVAVIPPAQCQCPPASCLPITVRTVRR